MVKMTVLLIPSKLHRNLFQGSDLLISICYCFNRINFIRYTLASIIWSWKRQYSNDGKWNWEHNINIHRTSGAGIKFPRWCAEDWNLNGGCTVGLHKSRHFYVRFRIWSITLCITLINTWHQSIKNPFSDSRYVCIGRDKQIDTAQSLRYISETFNCICAKKYHAS